MAMPWVEPPDTPDQLPPVAQPPQLPPPSQGPAANAVSPGGGMPWSEPPGEAPDKPGRGQPLTEGETGEALKEQFWRNATFGLTDPLSAAAAAYGTEWGLRAPPPGSTGQSWDDYYNAARQAQRQRASGFAAEHPAWATGTGIAGAVLPSVAATLIAGPGTGAQVAARSLPAQMLRAGAVGTGTGAVSGGIESENQPLTWPWAKDVLGSAALGSSAFLGPAVGSLSRIFGEPDLYKKVLPAALATGAATHLLPWDTLMKIGEIAGPTLAALGYTHNLPSFLTSPLHAAGHLIAKNLATPLGNVAARLSTLGGPTGWGSLMGNMMPSAPPGGSATL